MEDWEYAVGHQSMDDTWSNDTEPGTFETASRELIKIIAHGDEDWQHDVRIVKRSERHPAWAEVHDHAAELLSETIENMRFDFAVFGIGIMQGSDLSKVFRKIAMNIRNKLPQNSQEYGE